MDQQPAYSRRQFVLAVNLAALLGWAAATAPVLYSYWQTRTDLPGIVSNTVKLALLTAVLGIPIALAATWLVAAPVLRRIMKAPISWRRAVLWGIIIPAVMAASGVLLGRILGLFQNLDPNSWSQDGGGDYIQEVDGILTPYGWLVTGESSLIFVLEGFVIALIVRAVVGPGRTTLVQK
jgi:ABC-type Fe3+ transport system permease subunit